MPLITKRILKATSLGFAAAKQAITHKGPKRCNPKLHQTLVESLGTSYYCFAAINL